MNWEERELYPALRGDKKPRSRCCGATLKFVLDEKDAIRYFFCDRCKMVNQPTERSEVSGVDQYGVFQYARVKVRGPVRYHVAHLGAFAVGEVIPKQIPDVPF